MELDRGAAKGAIVSRETADPDLDEALGNAHQFQLGLIKEQNRHKETMRSSFSRIFGSDDSVPSYVAAMCAIFGLLLVVACYIAVYRDNSMSDFWGKQAERILGFVAAYASCSGAGRDWFPLRRREWCAKGMRDHLFRA